MTAAEAHDKVIADLCRDSGRYAQACHLLRMALTSSIQDKAFREKVRAFVDREEEDR